MSCYICNAWNVDLHRIADGEPALCEYCLKRLAEEQQRANTIEKPWTFRP